MYILSLFINLIVVISLYTDPHYQGLGHIMTVGYGLSLFGFLYQSLRIKALAYISMAGFVFFVPIGILGIIGVRKSMDEHQKAVFLKEQSCE
ncbi:hypothetical protein [Vibrio sp. LaRot3]|uniref:hypothetical protein n=1 Tax=Vibrio sp. LaRot3 TaxID=2998829 RepID=UPI0022CDF5D0|nr:hypothetical protein [Vibrio sp. LaRot3]MDA0150548.1 hypothetical protein [Vibrio sp. LaRot3]